LLNHVVESQEYEEVSHEGTDSPLFFNNALWSQEIIAGYKRNLVLGSLVARSRDGTVPAGSIWESRRKILIDQE
jgi:hypothetical protein